MAKVRLAVSGPSARVSLTALTVTVWARFQLAAVKVSGLGAALMSAPPPSVTVTSAVGWLVSASVRVSVAPPSVTAVEPPDWVTATVFVPPPPAGSTRMALILALSTEPVNSRFNTPSATLTGTTKSLATNWPPAADQTSRLSMTSAPSAVTSKTRWPAALK